MTYKITQWANDEILEINISGQATKSNAALIADEVWKIVLSQKLKRILVDVRKLEGRIGLAETVFLVDQYPSISMGYVTAALDKTENEHFYKFHETVSLNRGFIIRYFNDPVEARKWLGFK